MCNVKSTPVRNQVPRKTRILSDKAIYLKVFDGLWRGPTYPQVVLYYWAVLTVTGNREMGFSQHAEIDQAYSTVSTTFASHKTKSLQWRVHQLQRVWWMLEDNKDRIVKALHQDLHKHKLEALSVDVCGIQTACLNALNHLKSWTSDDKPSRLNALNLFGGARVRKEPKGVALILSAWNYPFMELFEPMICAIAAGCSMALKPSEVAIASQNLIEEIVPQYLDREAICVLTAGPPEMEYILQKRWDHIFFTGSTKVGRLIYEKAASHLTSVTLELGGQAPAIVSAKADIDLAAKRIAAAKFVNAGQVCLTVNHVFVDPAVKEQFLSCLVKYFDQYLLGSGRSPDYYSHIINDRNFNRLSALLEQTSGKVIYGGKRDATTRYFPPTVVDNVKPTDSLMSEELFGPILPILDGTLDEAIAYTVKNRHPLALYPFTNSPADKDKVLRLTASGGVTINDAIIHMLVENAPFGGTGHSGIGAYHGQHGFKEFTHFRTVVDIPKWMDILLKSRFPPYTDQRALALAKIFRPIDKVWFDRNGRRIRPRFRWVWRLLGGCTVLALVMVLLRRKSILQNSLGLLI